MRSCYRRVHAVVIPADWILRSGEGLCEACHMEWLVWIGLVVPTMMRLTLRAPMISEYMRLWQTSR